jgi:hypothetical protein
MEVLSSASFLFLSSRINCYKLANCLPRMMAKSKVVLLKSHSYWKVLTKQHIKIKVITYFYIIKGYNMI